MVSIKLDKIFILFALILFLSSFTESTILLDKEIFQIGESVVITIGGVSWDSIMVTSETQSYKFMGETNEDLIFKPKKPGIYEVLIYSKGNNIDKTTFEVIETEPVEPVELIVDINVEEPKQETLNNENVEGSDESGTDNGEKQVSNKNDNSNNYEIGDNIEIPADIGDDVRIEVKSDSDFFSYLGKITKKLFFTPKKEGVYEVTLKDKFNNIISSFKFGVGTEELTYIKNLTRPDTKKVLEEIDSKYGKGYDSILKLRNSDSKIKFIDAKILEDEIIIKNISKKLDSVLFRGMTKYGDLGFEEIEETSKFSNQIKKTVVDSYAVDPTNMDFDNASLIFIAQGTELYKCKDWEFSTQTCIGEWKKIMDLIPGEKYELIIDPLDPGYAETGVVSINTNKSTYHLDESAKILIAILDNKGYLLDPTNLEIIITTPSGKSKTYSLFDTSRISEGIYSMIFEDTIEEGTYQVQVNADGTNLDVTMMTSFEVKEFYEFDIIRNAPITTDPWQGPISSNIKINSFIDTDSGKITFIEKVPSEFNITENGGASIFDYGTYKTLTWENLDESSEVSYEAQPPLKTPDLFSIGPSIIRYDINSKSELFYEARPWFIAIDPVTTTTATSCNYMLNSGPDNNYANACSAASNVDYDDGTTESFTLGAGNNKYHGIEITASSLSNCYEVNAVEICTNWWGSGITYQSNYWLDVSNDGAGGASYTNIITSTGILSDGGVSCTDVSSSLTWDCTSFESDNAAARVHFQGRFGTAYFDVVYFKVNYTTYSNPPTAISYAKNESTVYENMSVKFNSTWSDDQGLSHYVFSINQGSGWVNSSLISFSGGSLAENISYISALSGTTVYWTFYANDTQGQWTQMPIQSFIVASASDLLYPVVNSINIDPTSNASGTIFNITANITDNFGVDNANAEITFPDGTKVNYSMTQVGTSDFWQYFYTSNVGGNFSVDIYASDANNNINISDFSAYFNVTSIVTTEKIFYDRGETVEIYGSGFSKNNDIAVTIKKRSDGSIVSSFPINVTSNSVGSADYDWTIPTDLTFKPGNYTIIYNDTTDSNLNYEADIMVVFRPDQASIMDRTRRPADVLSSVNDSDFLSATIVLSPPNPPPQNIEDYIEFNFTDNIPIGQDIQSVTFGFEHVDNQVGGPYTIYLNWYNISSTAWQTVCTYSPSATEIIDNCNLTSYIINSTEANSARIRISDNDLSSGAGTETLTTVDFAYLDIQYTTTATTQVYWNEPDYEITEYTFSDTTNNKAYHGYKNVADYDILYTTTEATSTNYTYLEDSDDTRYNYVATGQNNIKAYHSFEFTITDDISVISQLDFNYEGYATETTSIPPLPGIFTIFVWNFTSAAYQQVNTGGGLLEDVEVISSLTGNISEFINSSGEVYFLIETTQTGGGGDQRREIITDFVSLEVIKYPTISGIQYLNVTAIDSDGIGSCNYSFRTTSINGSLSSASEDYWNGTVDTNLLTDGFYWLDAVCVDSYGNPPANDSIYVKVSNSVPSVLLMYPINQSNFSISTFDIQFNTTSTQGGVISCNLTLNDGVYNSVPILANSGVPKNYTLVNLTDNDYYWNVTCWQEVSVTNTSETRLFTVDTTPPTIIKNYPIAGSSINTSSFDFLFTPSDVHDLQNCTLYIDGTINQTKNTTELSNGVQNNFSISGLLEGYHTWDMMCYDVFGNNQTAGTTNFTIDLTAPIVYLYAPTSAQLFGYNDIEFNWSAIDNLDLDLSCDLTIDSTISDSNVSTLNNTNTSTIITVVNGFHYWNVTCYDNAGNMNFSETRNFTVSAPPLPILISPQNYTGGFTTTNGTFTYNATHDAAIDNCSLYIDDSFNQANDSILLNGLNYFYVDTLSSGNHTWQVKCENPSGIGNSSKWVFWVDLVDPNVTLDTPFNGSEINSSNTILSWFAIDDLTYNMTCDLNVQGTIYGGITTLNNTNTTYNLTGLTDGTYYWNVTCYDRLNRTDVSDTWWFKINGAPSITLDYPINHANISTTNITFLFTPSDSGGLENCSIYLDGNLEDTKNSSELINGVQNNFTIYDILEGYHNWTIGCYDTVGDSSIAEPYNFTVDWTPPTITPLAPNATTYYTGDIEFNWTAIDALSEDLSCMIDISDHGIEGPYSVANSSFNSYIVIGISDGLHYYNITCADVSGNNATTTILNFTVDTAPVIILNSPIDYFGINDSQATFNYTASDTSGVENCSLYLNDAYQGINTTIANGGYNYFTSTGLSQGLYNWTIECTDSNGFTTNSTTEHFYIDTTPMRNLTINYPENNSVIHLSSIPFNITAVDDITQNMTCQFYIDGAYNSTIIAENNTPSINLITDFTEGPHSWYVYCFDSIGSYLGGETYYFNVSFDPLVSLINPQPQSWHNETSINLQYLPEDNNATLQWCDLYINDVYNNTQILRPSGVVSNYLLSGLVEGTYYWNWACFDWDNNGANSTQWNFTIDLTPPTTSIIVPAEGDTFNYSQILFNITGSDAMSPNLTCTIDLDGVIIANQTIQNDTNLTYIQYNVSDGIHYWNATCVDLAGNSNTTNTRNFTVQEPPRISLGLPLDNTRVSTVNNTFFFTPFDNSGNISNCTLILNNLPYANITSVTEGVENNITAYNMLNGEYNWTVNCTDLSGNTGTNTSTKRFIVDITPPIMNLTFPEPEQLVGSELVNFNWTATDTWATNLYCNLTIDDSVNQTEIPSVSGIFTNYTVSLIYGPHNWSLTCWDDLNNSNTSNTYNFTVQAPDLFTNNSRIYFNDSNPDLGDNITISLDITNIGSSTATDFKVQFFEGNPTLGGTQIGNNQTLTLAPSANITANQSWIITSGLHEIWALVNNDQFVFELDFTNNNATINISVLLSNITSPKNNTWTKDLTPEITFNLTDFIGGTINYTIFVDGNSNGQTGQATDSVITSLNLSALSEGTHYIVVEATDYLGRKKNSTAIYINVDNTSAIVNFQTGNNSWFNTTTPLINFSITDNLDTNLNYSLYVDQSYINSSNITNGTYITELIGSLSEGKHNVTIETLDEAGNIANYTLSIYVDTTKPNITLVGPEYDANLTSTSAILNITATDNLAPNMTCSINLDGTDVITQNITSSDYLEYLATNLSEGVHYWNATCADLAGNSNTTETSQFNIFIPPTIELISPISNYWTNNQTVLFQFNATDDTGFENCSLLIDGQINQTIPTASILNGGISNITSLLSEGTYNWSVICYDNTTQYVMNTSINRTINIDLTAPNASFVTLNQTWTNIQNYNISFNVTDLMADNLTYRIYHSQPFVAGRNNLVLDSVNVVNPSFNILDNISLGFRVIPFRDIENYIIIEVTDQAGNKYNTSQLTIYYDNVLPTVTLNYPKGNTSENDSMAFNFTASDTDSPTLDCNLTINGQVNKTYTNITSPVAINELITGFAAGFYYWNVTCLDLAGNYKTSTTENFTIPAPDLIITSGNITFSEASPSEGENITIYANIFSVGGTKAQNINVQFYLGDPDTIGIQIGNNATIPLLNPNENATVNVTWSTTMGTSKIYVIIDPPLATNGTIQEQDESNNKAFNTITISGYHVIVGNATSKSEMNNNFSNTLYSWLKYNRTGDNIFASDYESQVSWSSLVALGRNISGTAQSDDFNELDIALSMENFSDSINNTYTSSNSPKQTRSFTIFGNSVSNVPIINSTNSSNFVTGILWDSNDGSNYDGTQDVIFITEVNQAKQGYDGIYDFEIKVPAALREYKTANIKTVAFYAEIK